VGFHATPEDAEKAGFRPCLRCKPTVAFEIQKSALVARACRLIEQSETAPTLADLAKAANLSSYHFHRVFKSITGVTPKDYARAHRTRIVHEQLTQSTTVTEAIYGAGYNSGGRFYSDSNGMLGMTPRAYREGGTNVSIKFAVGECSLGSILVAKSERGVCAILLGDSPDMLVRDLQDRFAQAELLGGNEEFEAMVAQVIGFIEAPSIGLDLPLDIRGTAFQQRVWQALQKIPVGETRSYSELAQHIELPKAVRAVASACAANCLAVAIPCHRVIRNDGAVSGYRWGVDRKRALLIREAQKS
jgi:AraC family transcriptional regulator, regulatory protein of adaptative response / methylated-DNA-[protein]-cysteine methyltransferase